MSSSAQLERETEQTRSQLAQTLDELRARITPGQLVDQAVDYAKDSGGGMFVRNLGRHATANPLPIALIGAGMAWLMMSNGARSTRSSLDKEAAIDRARRAAIDTAARMGEAGRSARTRVSEWAADASAGLSEAGRQAAEEARDMTDWARRAASDSAQAASSQANERASSLGASSLGASSLGESTSSTYRAAKETASEAYGQMSDTALRATSAVTQSASNFGQRTADAGKDLLQFCKSQPLVLAGLGMALGAILGALIPPTETEDRLMGDTSDQLKDQARDAAQEQMERAKSAAQSGLNEARAEFDQPEADAQAGMPAETSLVPEAEHGTEPRASDTAAERSR